MDNSFDASPVGNNSAGQDTSGSIPFADEFTSGNEMAIPAGNNKATPSAQIVFPTEQISNSIVAQDMRIIGKFWEEERNTEVVAETQITTPAKVVDEANNNLNDASGADQNSDAAFTAVISKSQRKKMKQLARNARKLKALTRTGPQNYA